jgi:hypothetical protein
MSLNRNEQMLYDYVLGQVDERHHWKNKVQSIMSGSAEIFAAISRIDAELWRYYLERSEVTPVFVEAARAFGLRRTSMKNLVELLVRLWTEPRQKKGTPGGSGPGPENPAPEDCLP